jgi:hypothetical protein
MALALYLVLLGLATWKHTFWRDESQVWLMARDNGLRSLMHVIRYEGHPPLWHLTIWPIAHLTWNQNWMKLPNLLATLTAAWMVVSVRSVAVWARLGILFSYFMLFEFGLIDRDYMIGIALLIAAVAWIVKEDSELKIVAALALAAITSVPALEVSACLYAYFLWPTAEVRATGWPGWNRQRLAGLLLYAVLAGSSVWILRPPPDAATRVFQDHSSNGVRMLRAFAAFPRAYFPIPGAKVYFWNLTFFDLHRAVWSEALGAVLAIALVFFFRGQKQRWFFLATSVLIAAVISLLPGAFLRHIGWLFLVFLLALLLMPRQMQPTGWRRGFLALVLLVQAGAGIYTATVSLFRPFSSSRAVVQYMQQQQLTGAPLVFSEGVIGEAVLAEMQRRSAYYPEYKGQASFVTWNTALLWANHVPTRDELTALSAGGQQAVLITEDPLSNEKQTQLGVRLLRSFPDEIAYKYPYYLYQRTP